MSTAGRENMECQARHPVAKSGTSSNFGEIALVPTLRLTYFAPEIKSPLSYFSEAFANDAI